jgi:hypothetical protein
MGLGAKFEFLENGRAGLEDLPQFTKFRFQRFISRARSPLGGIGALAARSRSWERRLNRRPA